MLIYRVESIPDLTLSKYQSFADSGIDGMIEAQLEFIKQLYRVALLGQLHIHFIFDYDPEKGAGHKLAIYIVFSGENTTEPYYQKLNQIIKASNLSRYFHLKKVTEETIPKQLFPFYATLHKKERCLQTKIEQDEMLFYVVPNWEMNESGRLLSMIQLMQSFDVRCCYRVDLYVESDLEEQIHKSFEKPLTFLRNISNKDRGISEFSKIQKTQRDPNADETLHQYEDWLKAVDSSSAFRCRISAFSIDEEYCQLLLNAAIAESVASGNVTANAVKKDCTIFDMLDQLPMGDLYHLPNVPKSMQNWSTTYTAEQIAPFVRLPILYDGEVIELPKETAAIFEKNGIVLGKDFNGYDVVIPQKLLPKHMFVCGVPGSGKTNTMLHLANSLWNHEVFENGVRKKLHIPFLVLEPAKREYRELSLFDIPELLVFSPSACTNFPIRINPFEFPKGLTLSEHIGKLCQVFEGAFPIAPPAPFILDRAIQAIYEMHGWNVKDINTGTKDYPIMQELYDQFEKELQTTNYDSEIQGNIRSVLEMRIGSLLRREMREIFNAPKSTLSPEEWLTKPVIIELEALGEGPANFVTLLLCTLIRETLKANPLADKEKPVRHVIFIEEAHNLIAPESQVQDGMDSNPKVAATAFIVKMLAEVRALREGIIIADQLPTAMAPEVIKNTNIKLVHRLTAQDDRELVGGTMSASPLQMENMATYTSGQALFSYEKLLRPFEMTVHLVEEHGEETPNDEQLFELMMKKPAFCELRKKEEKNKLNLLADEVADLIDYENESAQDMLNLNNISFSKVSEPMFEMFYKRCLDFLTDLKSKRERVLAKIDLLSTELVEAAWIAELQEISANIGSTYEIKLKDFRKIYKSKRDEMSNGK